MIQYIDKDGLEHVELIEPNQEIPNQWKVLKRKDKHTQQLQTPKNGQRHKNGVQEKEYVLKVINEDQIFKNNKPQNSKTYFQAQESK